MILVDSSVWIDYFSGIENPQTNKLDSSLGIRPVAIGDLTLTEVLQGFRSDKSYAAAKSLLNELVIYDLLDKNRALQSAENYRFLRKKGIAIRKPANVVIATFCIEKELPLLFSDRDFKPFVKHLGLQEVQLYT